MAEVLKLLVIEDQEPDFLLIARHLRQQGLDARCVRVASLAGLTGALDEGGIDAVLSDFNVPGLAFEESLALIRARFPDLPVILVSGGIGEERAVDLLKLGVRDFVPKDHLARLASALRRSLADAAEQRARHEAEQALRESEERYRRLVEGLEDEYIFYQHDTSGVFTYLSPSVRNALGYAPEELRVPFTEILTASPLNQEALRRTEETLRGVVQPPYEVELRHKDGTSRLFEVLESPRFDRQGKVVGLEGIAHDITLRKAAEAATRAALARFEAVIQHTPKVAIRGFNRTGTVLHWNRASESLYGFSLAETLGRRLQDLLHTPETARAFEAAVDGIWRSGQPTEPAEWPVRTRDGRELWVYSTMFPVLEDARVVEVFCMDVDVTERKRAEEALSDRESRIRLLLQSTAESVYGMDLNGIGTFANPACVRMLGYDREEELIGRRVHELMHHSRADGTHAPAAECRVYRALNAAEPVHADDEVLWRRDGSSFPAEYWSHPMYRDGKVVGAVLTFLDITERRQREARLLRLNRTLRLLTECNSAMVRAEDESELLSTVCRVFTEHGGYQLAWVGFAGQDEACTLRLAAWTGEGSGYVDGLQVSYADVPAGRGVTGVAIRTGRPAYAPNIATDPGMAPFRERAARAGLRSAVSLPLRSRSGTFGALSIFAGSEDAFDQEEIALLEQLANDLAYGLVSLRSDAERSRVEEALRASEARHRAVAETASDAIVCGDQAGNIVAWNAAARRIFGYGEEEVLGQTIRMIMPERFRDAHHSGLNRYLETGVPRVIGRTLELEGRRRDGTEFPIEISLSSWTSEGKTFFGAIIRDISRRKRYESELERHAHYDTLTGLANRNLLQDRMAQAMVHAERSGRGVGVLLLNLDRLKLVNDSLGHGVGDTVLRTAAARIDACVREQDTVARLGGDEFVVVQSEVPDEYAVSDLARRLLDAVAAPLDVGDEEISITCSIGISMFPRDGDHQDLLLRNADAAVHRAREQGRGRLQFFAQEMNARATERLRIQIGLGRALERGEFRVHYQPVIDLVTGKVESVEALLRWQTPDGSLLPPAAFIGVAEETGLASAIGAWVLGQACAQARQWRERYDPGLRVTVNVSSVQIRDGTLAQAVRRALESSGLPAEALEIEISENDLPAQTNGTRNPLEGPRDLGARFTIDDFGSHYASLGFIREFPVDRVKLDQSFVREIANDAGNAAISRALITLAHGLGMKVTAKGVESEAQLSALRRFYCDAAQGSYFCAPAPGQEMEAQFSVPARRFSVEPSGRSLLLVDDEVNMLTALKRTLRREGYRILTASSGREALEQLASQEVGVILSDQRMPEMTGTELLGRVKLMYPRAVRIVLSGHTDLATITDAINRGAIYKFLTKPWEDDILRDTLREAFERHERSEV